MTAELLEDISVSIDEAIGRYLTDESADKGILNLRAHTLDLMKEYSIKNKVNIFRAIDFEIKSSFLNSGKASIKIKPLTEEGEKFVSFLSEGFKNADKLLR